MQQCDKQRGKLTQNTGIVHSHKKKLKYTTANTQRMRSQTDSQLKTQGQKEDKPPMMKMTINAMKTIAIKLTERNKLIQRQRL